MPQSGPWWVAAQFGGETCGLVYPCLIMSSHITKNCEGEQYDHVPMRKLYFRVKMRIILIDKCYKYRRICLGDKCGEVRNCNVSQTLPHRV